MNFYEKITSKYQADFLGISALICLVLSVSSLFSGWVLWSYSSFLAGITSLYLYSIYFIAVSHSNRKCLGYIISGFLLCSLVSSVAHSYSQNLEMIVAALGSFLIYRGIIAWVLEIYQVKHEKFISALTTFNSLLLLIIASGVYIENWVPIKSFIPFMFFSRDILVFVSVCTIGFYQSWHIVLRNEHGLRTHVVSVMKSYFKLNFSRKDKRLYFIMIPLVSGLLNLSNLVWAGKDELVYFNDYGFTWLLASLEILFALFVVKSEVNQSRMANEILPIGTRNFLQRTDLSFWAHTAANPTFVLSVDFDSTGSLKSFVPATIYQIQNEDFRNALIGQISDKLLDFSHYGSMNHLVFDPDQCVSVSQEALVLSLLCSLDLVRLSHQRSAMLIKLLPILDPDLARFFSPENVDRIQKNAIPFYYLDFSWVDQHLIRSDRFVRVGASFETVPIWLRESVLQLCETGISIENYIWLSESARDRIGQEIPSLKSIIEMRPFKIAGSPVEKVAYSIRLDLLASRLNSYGYLQAKRANSVDRQPSSESLSLIDTLNRRIDFVKGQNEIAHVVGTISSYRWAGFKEKDLALELLIRIWQEHLVSLRQESLEYKNLFQLVVSSIADIGYPTRYLHSAQLQKNTLRSIKELKKAALDVSNVRFNESWSLLSSGVYGRLSEKDAGAVMSLIESAIFDSRVKKQKIFMYRVMDVACFLLGRIDKVSDKELSKMIMMIFKAQSSPFMDPDILIMWADRWSWIVNGIHRQLIFSEEDWDQIGKTIVEVELFRKKNYSFLKAKIELLKTPRLAS